MTAPSKILFSFLRAQPIRRRTSTAPWTSRRKRYRRGAEKRPFRPPRELRSTRTEGESRGVRGRVGPHNPGGQPRATDLRKGTSR